MNRLIKVAASAPLAMGLVVVSTLPAAAGGSKECAANQRISVSSTTTAGSASPFYVTNSVNGVGKTWSTAGFHSYKSAYFVGDWAVVSNGGISSSGASCVAA